jgi:hypothetical protein
LQASAPKEAVFITHDKSDSEMVTAALTAEIVFLFAGVLANFSENLVAHIIDVFSVFKEGKFEISATMVR